MKTTLLANLRRGLLIMVTMTAFAATGARAANCEVQLSNTTVDYGRIGQAELDASSAPSKDVSLGKRRLTLNVLCVQPARMALRFIGTPAVGNGYLFSVKGNFTVQVSGATVDGNSVALATTDTAANASHGGAATQFLEPNVGVAAVSGNTIIVGKHFVAVLEFQSAMPRSAATVRDETVWEGSGQLTLIP